MVAESDLPSPVLPEFLRDLGRAAGGSSFADEQVSELMRTADDPLRVRGVLMSAGRERASQHRIQQPASFLGLCEVSRRGESKLAQDRFGVEPLLSASLHAERFVPMVEESSRPMDVAELSVKTTLRFWQCVFLVAGALVIAVVINLLFK